MEEEELLSDPPDPVVKLKKKARRVVVPDKDSNFYGWVVCRQLEVDKERMEIEWDRLRIEKKFYSDTYHHRDNRLEVLCRIDTVLRWILAAIGLLIGVVAFVGLY